ncbi:MULTISPECIES: hypothetical protein [Streptomyces]|uniref:DUF3592 domain-containing protein n=1 Tax=Streptomyces pseudovenezuelae TaxID=67350 RepID=A0A101NC36_9ACTN|nr:MULTISPECIES: hypothetical protein [Streptomyces]KUM90405.1 hypothetical protein AQI94_00940 [Streptomyces pseudovenezuelae]
MDVFFYLAPSLIMAVALLGAWLVVRRWLRMRSAWNSGLTAWGRCLRVYTTTHGGGDTRVRTRLHHVYEFTTQDGRVVRFEEDGGPGTTVEGDSVTVHYAAGQDVVATAHPRGSARYAAAAFVMLAFLGVIVLFCVGFMVTFATMSSGSNAAGF